MGGDAWQKRIRLYGIRVVLMIWVTVTLAAVTGMYHLWWTREYVLYGGKDVHEQRVEVFRRAGIARTLLDDVEKLDRTWPRDVRYEARGNNNQLSYIRYLLIPRIPDGNAAYAIDEKEGRLLSQPDLKEATPPEETRPSARGFFLSLFLLSGIAALVGRIPFPTPLSVPERFGVAILFLAFIVILSRAVLRDAAPGFLLIAATGSLGWIAHLLRFGLEKTGAIHEFRMGISVPFGTGRIQWSAALAVSALILVVSVWSILMSVIVVPDDWDAWAIWGAKAKVLALGTGPLRDVTFFPHADYPLLWPAVWAFSGWCAGGWEEHWSRAWGTIFMILSSWQIGIVVRRLTDRPNLGAWTAAVFLSIPMVALLATWSYAEASLWLMLSCSFGRLMLWRKERAKSHLLIAALFAAAAAYTKNEGVLFTTVCIIWITLLDFHGWRTLLRWYVLPFSFLYLPWFLWIRGVLGLGNHAFEGFQGGAATMARVLDRFPAALKSIGVMWLDIRQWNVIVWMVLVLSLVHLFRSRGKCVDLFVPWAMLFAFFVINVFHMQEIGILMSSWNRLTTQTLPMFLMVLGIGYLPAALAREHS